MRPKSVRIQIGLFPHLGGVVNGTGLPLGGVPRWTLSGAFQHCHMLSGTSHCTRQDAIHTMFGLRLYYLSATSPYSSCTQISFQSCWKDLYSCFVDEEAEHRDRRSQASGPIAGKGV